MGVGEIGGQFAKVDDGNLAWEDVEYDSDEEFEFESRWRDNEKVNGEAEVTTNLDKKGFAVAGAKGHHQYATVFTEISIKISIFANKFQTNKKLEFKTWRKTWRRDRKSLFRKIRKLSKRGMEMERLSCPYIDLTDG